MQPSPLGPLSGTPHGSSAKRCGRNANDLTSQALADMGGAATYYDCLVEMERV